MGACCNLSTQGEKYVYSSNSMFRITIPSNTHPFHSEERCDHIRGYYSPTVTHKGRELLNRIVTWHWAAVHRQGRQLIQRLEGAQSQSITHPDHICN